MIITYHGQGFVRADLGELVVAWNPISRGGTEKVARFGADLALVALADPAYNGVGQVTFGNKELLIIDGPGEYEVGEVFVRGLPSVGLNGLINTIYQVNLADSNLVHLGALVTSEISDEVKEALGV